MASIQVAQPTKSRQHSISGSSVSTQGSPPHSLSRKPGRASLAVQAAQPNMSSSTPLLRPPSQQPPPIPEQLSALASAPVSSDVDRTSNQSAKSMHAPSTDTAVSSQHSSLSGSGAAAIAVAARHSNPDAHPPRKLRSQYPRGATENHVEYILVASFDIDKGPIMEHQYPVAITGDEHMLAELMLPDQTHLRNQDWTMFFLHKDTTPEEEDQERLEKARRREKRRRKHGHVATTDNIKTTDGTETNGLSESDADNEEAPEKDKDADDNDNDDYDDDDDDDDEDEDSMSTDSEPEGGEGAPLIYVLNLVNTKQDKTQKRGAVVKSMAICTRHPFLHIYKPLLLLALEEYFKSPVPETLSMLYEAVNAMDLSLLPRLSRLERHLLQASENKDLFVDKFEQMIQMRIAAERGDGMAGQPLDASRSPPKPAGAILRSGTKAHFEGHATAYAVPRDTHEFESKVLYKGIPIPIKVPVAVMPENVGDFSLVKLIQNFADPHAKQPQPFAAHAHLTTSGPLTHPIIVLVNALLTQKRIIFLGHNMPSGEVAEAVLAACALASGGVLRGFTRHAFPYTDLTKIEDLLLVPGFIAGVTNPTFELHPEWWDLLCDLPSGRIKISSRIEDAPITQGLLSFKQQHPAYAALVNTSLTPASSSASAVAATASADLTGDNAFMADILKSIHARLGERAIRAKWRDWVVKFTRIAAAFEESVYGASVLNSDSADYAADLTANSPVATTPTAAIPTNNSFTATSTGHGYVWADDNAKQRELAGNVTRVEGWRNTRSYLSFIKDVAQQITVRPLKGLDLHHMHDRLRTQRLTPAQSREIYLTLSRHVYSYDEICLLLSVAPESHGGLFYVALGLFHRDKDVRTKTTELLERISEHEAGRHWWQGLSRFEKMAYMRIRRDDDAEMRGKLEKEGLVNQAAAAAAALAAAGNGSGNGGSSAAANTVLVDPRSS
ncbi:protein MesA [Grosmannia clavigera kw1407]|uniref:Protein MesA n=1 Tax=Grosmannia clavigera (strain kw1407 / UAMH 11150) TaxID=655863 RepID=F0XQA1_GROCL|nr:protein MesA [Grosmannia clavigera kw1407]EFX00253.1 protein MesA [Grosmannia clavigera kw1407]